MNDQCLQNSIKQKLINLEQNEQEEQKYLIKSNLPNFIKRVSLDDLKLRNAQIFTDKAVIGEGTFGKVYKARIRDDQESGLYYALKMIKMDNDKEGFPITAMREIKILKQLKHPNIVNLVEIITSAGCSQGLSFSSSSDTKSRGQVYLVFEYAQHDLQGVLEKGVMFNKSQFKCLVKQLVQGIEYLHSQGIMHRDIKGGNILLTKDGILKIADFGLARDFIKVNNKNFTVKVVTRWYRAPELLLGNQLYNESIDVWSVGCLIAEMLIGRPLFPGKSDSEQLPCIYDKMGVPCEESWPRVTSYRGYPESFNIFQLKQKENPMFGKQNLRQYLIKLREESRQCSQNQSNGLHLIENMDDLAIDLIEKMLSMDPDKRITAKQALSHNYLTSEPLPCLPSEIPQIEGELKELNFRDDRQQKIAKNYQKESLMQKQLQSKMEVQNQKIPGGYAAQITPPRGFNQIKNNYQDFHHNKMNQIQLPSFNNQFDQPNNMQYKTNINQEQNLPHFGIQNNQINFNEDNKLNQQRQHNNFEQANFLQDQMNTLNKTIDQDGTLLQKRSYGQSNQPNQVFEANQIINQSCLPNSLAFDQNKDEVMEQSFGENNFNNSTNYQPKRQKLDQQ